MIATYKHYIFHLSHGEAIEVDCDPRDVALDSDYLVLDLPLGREVIIARRYIVFIQVRDCNV